MKTKKKMKVVGAVEYINKETGELEVMQTVKMESRDFNFDKIWILHVLESLDAIGNQKIKVMNALIKLKDINNQIVTCCNSILMEINRCFGGRVIDVKIKCTAFTRCLHAIVRGYIQAFKIV